MRGTQSPATTCRQAPVYSLCSCCLWLLCKSCCQEARAPRPANVAFRHKVSGIWPKLQSVFLEKTCGHRQLKRAYSSSCMCAAVFLPEIVLTCRACTTMVCCGSKSSGQDVTIYQFTCQALKHTHVIAQNIQTSGTTHRDAAYCLHEHWAD